MKKRLITLRTTLLAILAIFAILLVTINPAAAATASSIRIVPNEGAPNSGYFVLNVAPADTVIVDLYAVAPGTGVKTSIVQKAVTYDGPVDQLVLGYTFSGLAVGTTVYACLIMDNVPDCSSMYVVPGTNIVVDTDKDGLNDDVDNCDNAAGPASNGGCPVVVPEPVDTDKDGVTDDKDNCDNAAGPASNGGCPVDVSPKKAAVCKYVGKPGVDERLQTGQNPIVVDRKDWMVIGSPFQDAQGRSIVIAFLNPQDAEPSVDQCPVLVVDVCPEEGVQPPGTDCESEVPTTCPPGLGWNDVNGNNKIDEGECRERTGPISGPPAVTPPAVTPPAETPRSVVPAPAAPAAVVPATAKPATIVPAKSAPLVAGADGTNGRGVTAETAAVGVSDSESGIAGTGNQWSIGLAGLAILLALAVAARRTRQASSK